MRGFSHRLISIVTCIGAVFCFVACSTSGMVQSDRIPAQQVVPRYVFYFIGDGMGAAQVKLAESLLESGDSLEMTSFPASGMAATHAENRYITGSAAAGTALATGKKTTIGTIGKNGSHTATLKTMAEMSRDRGMRVGIVSSASIDHATPACFYAHVDSRKMYAEIAAQMASSGFDYFGGGYALGDLDNGRPLGRLVGTMKDSGYAVVQGWEALGKAVTGRKYWAFGSYDGTGALGYAIDRAPDGLTLADFTRHGIRLLDNDRGFFLMVEGGKIDWASHANDAATTAHEVLEFDEAVAEAVSFYRLHPDETLIVVTADHECGGLALGNRATAYESDFTILSHQKLSFQAFAGKVKTWVERKNVSFPMVLDSAKVYFGLGDSALDASLKLSPRERTAIRDAWKASREGRGTALAYGSGDPLTVTLIAILNEKAGIGWTSSVHTAGLVPVFAIGQGANRFNGVYDNTDIAKKLIDLIGRIDNSR
ncbi:MAG: alkaline phosphatase [Chlorobium phaeobacteroides]|uniref:Alkaline phosphatase n=1 Tax=Chlorobium phaeobacteroides (strain BS1) TaxID=331678 RepID=B3EQ68_CHLPB|nr:alkaline phosphatase [Chlorobium phaeobacteroides]